MRVIINYCLIVFSFILFVGLNENDQMVIYQILAAILHLSNVEVKDQSGDRSSILVNTKYFVVCVCIISCQNIILRLSGSLLMCHN